MSRLADNLGVGSLYGSFQIDGTSPNYDLTDANVGQAVGLSGNNEVDLGSNGGAFLGRLVSVQTDIAVVQLRGVMRIPYNAASAPALGGTVVLDGAGKVKSSASGRGIVIALDSTAETADVLL
ncbi:MAG: hypothetical protein KJ050_14605 [Candidatus Omnitrophica bacterium]|nr:MAG: hypothetical protein UZ16_OP3001002861 [Candidatus Hinthialibacteria bacterium OLB16]MBE7488076.1 hypothetical protein [bacterium]MBK7496419.1 hypothetical protein [Candidatus Omnitrophota bacterium]MCE7908709.1 hypothetical protein [Candidatus Omnitrophica bacterium COP1]MBV6482664.1 hypothetical protein [bacterium]